MEPTADEEVREHFAGLEDDPLLQLAEERDDLTDRSQQLLLDELARRKLAVPAIVPRAEYDAQTWVTVERFRDLSAGLVARGALEAAGIECFLRDENTVRLDWQISNFIGGMRLQVAAEDEAAAREVLQGLGAAEEPASNTGAAWAADRCAACGSAHIARRQRYRWWSLVTVYLFAVPIVFRQGRPQWNCEACGARWDDPP